MSIPQHRKAFTLVELLVAITIVAIIISISMFVLLSARKMQQRLEAKHSCQDKAEYAVRQIETTLRLAQALVAGTCSTITFLDVQSDTCRYYLSNDTLFANAKPLTNLAVSSLRLMYFEAGTSEGYIDFRSLDNNQDGTLFGDEIKNIRGINLGINFVAARIPDTINVYKEFSVSVRNIHHDPDHENSQ